jgi:hypothetical protein
LVLVVEFCDVGFEIAVFKCREPEQERRQVLIFVGDGVGAVDEETAIPYASD